MTSVECCYPLSLPSSSSFNMNEKRGKIRKNSEFLRRKALFRLAARKIKWAKRTVTLREIRLQIDKEFEGLVSKSQNYVNTLQNENDELRKAATDMFNKCSSLLTCVETLSQSVYTVPQFASEWDVPGSQSPNFSDSDSESFTFYLPQIELKKSIR